MYGKFHCCLIVTFFFTLSYLYPLNLVFLKYIQLYSYNIFKRPPSDIDDDKDLIVF